MPKYIRTKDGRIAEIKDNMFVKQSDVLRLVYKDRPYICVLHGDDEIIKQSDTIEELCDGFYADDGSIETYNKNEFNRFQDYILDTGFDGYGFIKTDKGLIYVAKLDNDGELVLI